MRTDVKKITEETRIVLKEGFGKIGRKIKLAMVVVGRNDKNKDYVEQIKKFAYSVGVGVKFYNFLTDISTAELRKQVSEISRTRWNGGVLISLPLPEPVQASRQYIINAILPRKDVGVVTSRALGNFVTNRPKPLPPIVGAVKEILERNKVDVKGKKITTGNRLIASWLMSQGAVVTYDSAEKDAIIEGEDIMNFEDIKTLSVAMIFRNLLSLQS